MKAYFVFCLAITLFALEANARAEEENTVSLATALVRNAHLPEAQADEQAERVFSAIRTELKSGRAVEIKNFGRFYVSERKTQAKAATAPGKNRKPQQAAKKYPRFTSANALKAELNPQQS